MPSTITCPHCSTSHPADTNAVGTCTGCGQAFAENKSAECETIRQGIAETSKKKAVQTAAPYAPPKHAKAGLIVSSKKTRSTGKSARKKNKHKIQHAEPFAAPGEAPPGRVLGVGVILGVVLLLLAAGGAVATAFVLQNQDSAIVKQTTPTPGPLENDPILLAGAKKRLEKAAPPNTTTTPEGKQQAQAPTPQQNAPPANNGAAKAKPSQPQQPTPPLTQMAKKPRRPLGNFPIKTDPHRANLSAAHQKKVNKAIDKGVAWLRARQQKDGSWGGGGYNRGYTALAALTLLNCGVKADEPAIQKAAQFVRLTSHDLRHTYQISLVILFLDKVGDSRDNRLITKLALRLIAGQNRAGGWHYQCPILKSHENMELLVFLQRARLRLDLPLLKNGKDRLDLPLGKNNKGNIQLPLGKQGKDKLQLPVNKKDAPKLSLPLGKQGNGQRLKNSGVGEKQPGSGSKKKPGLLAQFDKFDRTRKANAEKRRQEEAAKKAAEEQKKASEKRMKQLQPIPRYKLTKRVRELPVIQKDQLTKDDWKRKSRKRLQDFSLRSGSDDNSNTQFAMMALWAARRRSIPVERTLSLVDERFNVTQFRNGGWAYNLRRKEASPQMTCVGLIGLALGHGAYRETYGNVWSAGKSAKQAQKDPRIQRGLKYLGQSVDKAPKDWKKKTPLKNLYYLWSLERTAMLYSLKTVGGNDWYAWSAQMLVVNQHDDGHWQGGGYPGSSPTLDTSLSLLILRRANLVADLSSSLRLYLPIIDPDARR